MKLKDTFITYTVSGEHIMVATEGYSGIVRSNGTGAFIIECLKGSVTRSQLVDAMAEKYDAPRATIEKDVAAVIARLRSIGAIEGC